MPHSLRAKIKGLRYKGIITDKDCERLCKALDNEDVLEQIRAEIKALSPEPTAYDVVDGNPIKDAVWETLADVLQIIDRHMKGDSE